MSKKTTKILMLLSNPFLPDDRVNRESQALAKAGYKVTILAWDREKKYPKVQKYGKVTVKRVGFRSPYGGIATIVGIIVFDIIVFFKACFADFDIIHAHDFDTLIPGLCASKIKLKKVVYDSHEFYPAMVQSIQSGPLVTFLSKIVDRLELILIKHVDFVITVVPYLEERYRKAKKVDIIYNAKTTNPYSKTSPKVKQILQGWGAENKFVYLFVGLLDRRRNLTLQIETFKKLSPDFVFVIMGHERDLTYAELRQQIRGTKNIVLQPPVPSPELPPYVAAADVVDVLHNPEDFNFRISYPNKFFEATAAGKPMIITRGMDLANMVEKKKLGTLVKFNNRDDLRSALIELKQNKKLYQETSLNCRHLGHKIFNWTAMDKKLVQIYSEF